MRWIHSRRPNASPPTTRTCTSTWAWLGVSRPDRAESAWKRTLELQPRHGEAAVNVIDLLIRTDRPSEAETILRTVRDTGVASPLLDSLEGKLRILQNDRLAAREASFASVVQLKEETAELIAREVGEPRLDLIAAGPVLD